jgi:hypothetical protein
VADTDHLGEGDVDLHCQAWYSLLPRHGMVMIRVSSAVHAVWLAALKKARFKVMPGWGGYAEVPRLTQVTPLILLLFWFTDLSLL